jgi:hypothetical protein
MGLSEPSSDGVNASLWLRWEESGSDCTRQIAAYNYWGDGSLRSPELSAYTSSSPAVFPIRSELSVQIDHCKPASPVLKTGVQEKKEKRRPNFSQSVKERLLDWLKAHQAHPYPDSVEITRLATANNLSVKQVRTFFVNNRMRVLRAEIVNENASTVRKVD